MNKSQIQSFKGELADEKNQWQKVQDLRNSFSTRLFDSVNVKSKEEALERAVEIVHKTLEIATNEGLDFNDAEPGHSIGHMIADYTNALTLLNEIEAEPSHIFVGFTGGVLHDIGCAVMKRYDEHNKAVRHAEAGALLLQKIFQENPSVGLNEAESILIPYVVASHTHYTKPPEVKCSDDVTRKIEPYQDLDESGKPIYAVWFPRWVDRLDCNGPRFVPRHYLTLAEEHKDFDGKVHFDIKFKHHMKPLLRAMNEQKDESGNRNQTMSEHMKMFADSQSNDSAYGKHDFGKMTELRDSYKQRLLEIIESTQRGVQFSFQEEIFLYDNWNDFLHINIEPTESGRKTADSLDSMFSQLPDTTRFAWLNGFSTCMREYKEWAEEKLQQLETIPYKDIYNIPGVSNDIREFIAPVIQA